MNTIIYMNTIQPLEKTLFVDDMILKTPPKTIRNNKTNTIKLQDIK